MMKCLLHLIHWHLPGKQKKYFLLPDESFAFIKKDMIELYDFTGKALPLSIQELELDWEDLEKKGHEHHMLKEIYDQKNAIYSTVAFFSSISNRIWDHVGLTKEQANNLERIDLIGCGTSWHAARIAQFFFEQICIFRPECILLQNLGICHSSRKKTVSYIFISQSGETADTLESLRLVNSMDLPTIALTNVAFKHFGA